MSIRSLETVVALDCSDHITIVGAGAIGIAMAIALSRTGQKVTLFEGGSREPPANFETRNAGSNLGREHTGLKAGRMQAFGGTTLLWGGQLVPFDAGDFNALDATGRALWPISNAETAPWIEKAYSLLGVPTAARRTRAIWEETTGQSAALGKGLFATMNIWLQQPDFTRLFGRELERNPFIDVVTDARLTHLQFNDQGTAEQIALQSPSGRTMLVRTGCLVLAHGTIEIARTLLRAQHDPACPFAGNKHVGRWFMDHLHGLVGTMEVADASLTSGLFDTIYRDGIKYTVKVRLDSKARAPGTPNIAATLNPALSAGEVAREALALLRRAASGRGSSLAALGKGIRAVRIVAPAAWRYLRHRRAYGLYGSAVKIGLEVEQRPSAGSTIRLEGEELKLDWRIDGEDVVAIAGFVELLAGVFTDRGLGTITPSQMLRTRDARMLDEFHDAYHHLGGARMAHNESDGVVDSQGRIFGTSNLYVAGAATFPTGSFANPALTAIALGLRLAAHLRVEQPQFTDRLVFGTGRLAGGATARSAAALIDAVLDGGVRRLDTGPPYGIGTAEDVVGRVLRRRIDRDDIIVIAKVGLPRVRHAFAKSLLRAAKRAVRKSPPRSYQNWVPEPPRARFDLGSFGWESMSRSVAMTNHKLCGFDYLLLHECGADEFTRDVAKVIERLSEEHNAKPGYGWGAHFDETLDASFPSEYLAECAIPPQLLGNATSAPARRLVLHSIVPTAEYLARTDREFAAMLVKVQSLFLEKDSTTARIAAIYVVAAIRAPNAWLVFSSSRREHVDSLLAAFREIDRRQIVDSAKRIVAARDMN